MGKIDISWMEGNGSTPPPPGGQHFLWRIITGYMFRKKKEKINGIRKLKEQMKGLKREKDRPSMRGLYLKKQKKQRKTVGGIWKLKKQIEGL